MRRGWPWPLSAVAILFLPHCFSGNAAPGKTQGESASSPACAADAAADVALQTYGPNDPSLDYVGRIDLSDPAGPWMIASATYVTAHFTGEAAAVELNDQSPGGIDFFDVVIDGRPPFVLAPASGATWYGLSPPADAGALGCGDHTLTLIKRTEATVGTTQVLGFRFAATSPPSSSAPPHRIEIVGDSLLCGYGTEADAPDAAACSDNGLGQPGYGQGVEDGYEAFGAVMARALGAEWHVTCESGVGLVRNTDNGFVDPRPMPVLFPLLHPEDPSDETPWPPTQWAAVDGSAVAATPDLVVIELGGNDLSLSTADGGQRPPIAVGSPSDAPDAGPSLVAGFIAFIDQLAADYPGAVFILAQNAPEVQSAIDAVVSYYGDAGAAAGKGLRVYEFGDGLPFPGDGCAGHPNVAQQATAGAKLAAYAKQVMGW